MTVSELIIWLQKQRQDGIIMVPSHESMCGIIELKIDNIYKTYDDSSKEICRITLGDS